MFEGDGLWIRCRQFRCLACQLSIARRLAGSSMCDNTFLNRQFGHRHFPFRSCRLQQHDARSGTALTHIFVRLTNPAAAACGHIAPHSLACKILSRGKSLQTDFGPIAFQFFGHQLGQTGMRTLPHFSASDTDDTAIIWTHHHPGVDFAAA